MHPARYLSLHGKVVRMNQEKGCYAPVNLSGFKAITAHTAKSKTAFEVAVFSFKPGDILSQINLKDPKSGKTRLTYLSDYKQQLSSFTKQKMGEPLYSRKEVDHLMLQLMLMGGREHGGVDSSFLRIQSVAKRFEGVNGGLCTHRKQDSLFLSLLLEDNKEVASLLAHMPISIQESKQKRMQVLNDLGPRSLFSFPPKQHASAAYKQVVTWAESGKLLRNGVGGEQLKNHHKFIRRIHMIARDSPVNPMVSTQFELQQAIIVKQQMKKLYKESYAIDAIQAGLKNPYLLGPPKR